MKEFIPRDTIQGYRRACGKVKPKVCGANIRPKSVSDAEAVAMKQKPKSPVLGFLASKEAKRMSIY
jgi:hypothetical protein